MGATWAMRSPRRTPLRCSRSWPTRRTRMVSSPTNPSWTGFAARHKSLYTSSSTQRLTNFASLETSQTAQQSGLQKTSIKSGGQISRLYQEKMENLRNRTTSHGFFIREGKKIDFFFRKKTELK